MKNHLSQTRPKSDVLKQFFTGKICHLQLLKVGYRAQDLKNMEWAIEETQFPEFVTFGHSQFFLARVHYEKLYDSNLIEL